MVRLDQEEGRYRVLLIGIGDNTEEEKKSFSHHVSKTYSIPFPLLKKIVDRCPIVLKKNLSLKKAQILAKTLKSFGAAVSVEERRNFPPVSLEFQELVPYRLALESAYLRKTERGMWNVIGRARNIFDETLTDAWVLVQVFDDLEEFIAFEETPLAINPLPPGEISPFKVILSGDLIIRRVSVGFKNASGAPIPALDERKKREWVGVEIEDDGLSSSWTSTGFGEKLHPLDPAESSQEKVLPEENDLSTEPLSSDQGEALPSLFGGESEMGQEEVTEEIPQEPLSLSFEPPEEISDPSPNLVESSLPVGEQASEGVVGDEAARPEQMEETVGEERVPAELGRPSEGEMPEASRLDASVFEEATQLLEDISEGPGEIEAEEKKGKRAEEEPPSFPWIEHFREAVQAFYQKPRDIFSIWFEECRKEGEFKDSLHALLTILVHSRFDQGSQSVKALENTQRVSRLIVQPNVLLDDIPPLEETPFVSGEVWRELFHRALPKVQQIGKTILGRCMWKGFELECLIQVVPHMGHQSSRTAIRWFKELIPDVIEVDFSDTPVPVGEGFYRVASRLGIVDPHFDHYQGRNSMADVKIQSFAKMAYPQNPLEVEEPMAWTGRAEEQGGHCSPVQPKCEGCIFESFCPKLYVHFDPSEKGMREGK
ncbi:MAG: hypothetical protein ACXU99_00100 [Thermodesulfobacteriota bacterium]